MLLVQVRVGKWLKELEKMFYGACEAYEKVHKRSACGVGYRTMFNAHC